MPPNVEKREIKISIDTGQSGAALKQVAAQMGELNKSVKGISSSFTSLRDITAGFAGASILGFGIRELTQMADSMTLLSSRINILSGDNEKGAKAFQELSRVASNTKTSIDSIAQIYARLATSTRELNLSQESLISLTEFLQNTYRLSGATTEEAVNSTIQLTQAFSLSVLRGQDLKSVMSQNVVLTDILTRGLGTTRGGLLKMAEAGKLVNSVVFPAMAKGMEEVNLKATKLSITFEQAILISLNKFKLAIKDVNEKLKLSDNFAVSMELLSKAMLGLALATIPSVIAGINRLRIALLSLAVSNPFTALLTGIAFAIGTIIQNFEELQKAIKDFSRKAILAIDPFLIKILEAENKARNFLGFFGGKKVVKANNILIQQLKERDKALQAAIDKDAEIERLKKEKEKRDAQRAAEEFARIESIEDLETKRANLLIKLNSAYKPGISSVREYYSELRKLDKQIAENKFKTGKTDLEQFNNEMKKINLANINTAFTIGATSFSEFNAAIEQNKIDELNSDLEAGKISILEYDAALIKVSNKFLPGSAFRTGAEDYLKSIGTLSQGIASVVTGTFSKLEDALVEFTKNGKFNFNQFAQAILDDLNRIIIRSLIIRPLAEGLLNFTPSSYVGASNSGVGAVRASAKGDIFDSMTPYIYGRGKLGVMGEKGPEAIMPLKRGADGSLGVTANTAPVFVNITNQTGGEVSQKETTGPNGEKVLEILIQNKMKEGIASGALDRTFSQSFGLKRRGT